MRNIRKLTAILAAAAMSASLISGCGQTAATEDENTQTSSESSADETTESESTEEAVECELEDGTYTAAFNTDSSMFHANEACDGKGTLTVENGHMTIHVSLVSENIVNLFVGTAEDAQKDGAELLEPTTDTVTYDDGDSEEVYGFDIPVAAIGEDFDLAILGTKGKWYDHVVSVSDPEPAE